mmetsp:Transcript_13260/g.22502  ORF Transcript_13260/g.22502 Transcript_13260/m.22502 type:complete len:116 (-) Transcript_13260:553-900(-)
MSSPNMFLQQAQDVQVPTEIKLILSLKKVTPSVRPVKVPRRHRRSHLALSDAQKAARQQLKSKLIVSIPLARSVDQQESVPTNVQNPFFAKRQPSDDSQKESLRELIKKLDTPKT